MTNKVIKSFADLPELLTPAEEAKQRLHSTTEPIYIRKLVELYEGNKSVTASAIGVTATTISLALRTNKISYPMELAARYVYELNKPKANENKLIVTMSITQEAYDNLKFWLDNAKIAHSVFTR